MAIYATQTSIFLAFISLPAILSLYFFFKKKNTKVALVLLVLTGLLLSLFMAAIDPYLHPWDERFHALVAKNMMDFPFKPMLLAEPVYAYNASDWNGNHVWLHKQPLFLWQMALSMKVFGVHEIAMRLPAVIMTCISIFFVFGIAKHWVKNNTVAYIAAFLFTFSNYQLELLSGRYPLDQNDVAFAFYGTAAIWAFVRYLHTSKPWRWVILIGVFAGAAILNKWLTGLLIFGGWGLYLLFDNDWRFNFSRWFHLIAGVLVCALIFMPWQIYISNVFPVESAISYAHNSSHLSNVVEGNDGTAWFHVEQLMRIYGLIALIFMIPGVFFLFKSDKVSKQLSASLLSMVLVIYLFFSLIVTTKMPSFTYPINIILWIIAAFGLYKFSEKYLSSDKRKTLIPVILFVLGVITLRPWHIIENRNYSNTERTIKIQNTEKYKSLNLAQDFPERVIINCKTYEDIELMFYQNVTAYHWFPSEQKLDSLTNEGIQFAAFQSFGKQYLPEYILEDEGVVILALGLE